MNENKNTLLPCHVVRDLLPLYHDGVVSAETRSAVGEHLMECESCRAEFEAMKKPLPEQAGENKSTLEWFRALMRRQKRKKVLAIVLAVVLAAAAAAGGIAALSQFCIVPVRADEFDLQDVCLVETPEGRMAFVLWSDTYGGATATRCRFAEADDGGRVEIEIKHPLLEWVSVKGSERLDYWFVPIEGDVEEVRFNGKAVWTEAEDGIREDTGYARAVWEMDRALWGVDQRSRQDGGMTACEFTDDYVYLLFPDGHEEYWSYDGEQLDGPSVRDDGEIFNISPPVTA